MLRRLHNDFWVWQVCRSRELAAFCALCIGVVILYVTLCYPFSFCRLVLTGFYLVLSGFFLVFIWF